MTSSDLAWIALPLLLFWGVGAYNRLVRLRSEVNAAFAALAVLLQKHVQLADDLASPEAPASGLGPDQSSFVVQIQGASAQLAACVSATRARPLDAQGIDALAAAGNVLTRAWERAEREDAHDLAGPQLPAALSETRAELLAQIQVRAGQFNEAVERYNSAIGQFPAMLLAWLFGFRPGRVL